MQRLLKEMTVIAVGIVAVIYLANPTFGVFELIPDTMPLVGNLDEAGAVFLLISVLRYYGIDPSSLFERELPEGDHRETS